MNSDQSDLWQEDDLYDEDEEDLYTPMSGADFRVNIGASINSRIIPPASSTSVNNLLNPPKMEEMENSTPSISNRYQTHEDSTANDQNTVIARRWTDEWEAENARNQEEEAHRSNRDLSSENEKLQKKMQQLEEIVAEVQRQFENNHLRNKTASRNAVKSEIEIIKIDDDEQTVVKEECAQSNNESLAEYEKLQNKVQRLEDIVAEQQRQLKQLQIEKDQLCNKTPSKNAVKSEIDVIEINDDDEEPEVKQECGQTSQDVALEVARTELDLNHFASVDPISPETGLALTDCQPSLLPFTNHQSDIRKEPTEEREVSPNIGFSTSLNLYPGAIYSSITENECEANTTDCFHGTIEEAQDSDGIYVSSLVTDQVIDNDSIQSSVQNETAVDLNASSVITDMAISVPIPAEISLLKRSKGPIKQTESSASNALPVASEPVQNEEMSLRLRLRGRKQIHNWGSNFEDGHDRPAERKRSRLSHTEQNLPHFWEGNSMSTSVVSDQNPQQHGESTDKSATNGNESEYARGKLVQKIEEKQFKCGDCSFSTKYKHHLLTHRRIHTGEKPYKCTQCSYKCTSAYNLKMHMRTHTGEKPYKCSQCSYESTQPGALKLHMRTHTGAKPFIGERPYKCEQCSYASVQFGSLKSHMLTHTGEKPHKCSQCSYACAQATHLTIHIRTHTDEKPYKCFQCSFASAQSSALKAHIRTHTGEKPYKCSRCSYACSRPRDLKSHMRTHTGEKPYKCSQCSYACADSSSLKRHFMLLHVC